MARFEDLQQLWQRQPERRLTPRDAAEISDAFRRFRRRNDRIAFAKLVFLAAQLCFVISVFRHRPVTLFGACLLGFSALYFMLTDWRKQRAIFRMDFATPSVDFVRHAIARLNAQRTPFHSLEFRIAFAGVWTGCALLVAGKWSSLRYPGNLIFAVPILLAPFLGFRIGLWVRAARFRLESRPLIERLERVLATMQETTESDSL